MVGMRLGHFTPALSAAVDVIWTPNPRACAEGGMMDHADYPQSLAAHRARIGVLKVVAV